MILTRTQARKFYDRFGAKQDTQAFYEDAALDDLVAHAAFGQAQSVFELGCGTGRFAARLLAQALPASASYFGTDLSRTMIGIADERMLPYAGRAKVMESDGSMHLPLADRCVERVVSTYVLDLLPETDIREVLVDAARVLIPGGKLCLVSLSRGVTFASVIVSALWSAAWRLHAAWVGGCRPIRLESFLDRQVWSIEYCNVVVRFGVPSEVLIASLKSVGR